MRKLLVALTTTLFVASIMAQAPHKGDQVQLHILETTDVHGAFFPYNFITGKPTTGSLSRVSHYVDSLRQACPDHVVLLDAGDILQGQPTNYYSNFIDTAETNIAARVINYMKYDAICYGNHDIETGHAVYDKWMSELHCPALAANMFEANTGYLYAVPYKVIERGGLKIAVLGMITPAVANWLTPSLWEGVKFVGSKQMTSYWVNFIRKKERPDILVGLFHSGYDKGIVTDDYLENATRAVARGIPGFDIIFYGHDHKRRNGFEQSADSSKVLLLNPGTNAKALADATVTMEYNGQKWNVANLKGRIAKVSKTPVDSAFIKEFEPFTNKVKAWTSEVVGNVGKTLTTKDCYFGNSEFNDYVIDLMLRTSGAEIALSSPLTADATIPAGPITRGQLFNLYRFENYLYVMNISGKELRGLLEMSYANWVNTLNPGETHLLKIVQSKNGKWSFINPPYNFDAAGGIDYEVDVTKPEGERVNILRMSNGAPFDEDKIYKVAVNSYRGNGGGELLTRGAGIPRTILESRIVWKSERDLRHYAAEDIRKQGTIMPKRGHNWKFVPERLVKPAAARDRALLFPKK